MKVYVLDNGRMQTDFAQIVNLSGIATNDNRNPSARWITQPVYTVLIDHPEGYILFDAACHPDAMTTRWTEQNKQSGPMVYESEDQLLPNTLKKMGLSCGDIRWVVASHLHEDHAGCLEYFKNAQIIANGFEFTMAMKTYALGDNMGAYIRKDIAAWIDAGLNWRLLEPEDDMIPLASGVTLLNFGPGHTYGMLGLLLQLEKDQNIILASDTIFTTTNFGPPVLPPAVLYDSIGYFKTASRIHRLAAAHKAQVWFGHDMKQFDSLRKAPDYYT